MKKAELLKLKEKVLKAVKEMPYGEYATTARIAYSIEPDAECDMDDLYDLERAIYSLEESKEMVFDKFEHYNMDEGLPYNLDFVKLKNKGVPVNLCSQIEFRLEEDNLRRVIEGIIDFRTGRAVIAIMGAVNERKIVEISEEERINLMTLFTEDSFIEEEKEFTNKELSVLNGIEWSITVCDGKFEGHMVYGKAGEVSEIPMEGAVRLFELVKKIGKEKYSICK